MSHALTLKGSLPGATQVKRKKKSVLNQSKRVRNDLKYEGMHRSLMRIRTGPQFSLPIKWV